MSNSTGAQVDTIINNFNRLADTTEAAGFGSIWEDAQVGTEERFGPEPTDRGSEEALAWWTDCYMSAMAEADSHGIIL